MPSKTVRILPFQMVRHNDKNKIAKKKYSNKLSMKALVEKDILMKIQEKGMRKAPHLFYVHLSRALKGTQGNSRELKGTQGNSRKLRETQGNSRELKGTQGNSRELKGTGGNSREALVEVMEGKKLRKRG